MGISRVAGGSSLCSGMDYPLRSDPSLLSSAGLSHPCITPSTETFVVVGRFVVAGPFSDGLCCDR